MMKPGMIVFLLLAALPLQAGVNGDLRQGGKLYRQGKYGAALSKFEHALQTDPHNPTAAFGAGAASYYLKEYNQAAQSFEQAAGQPGKLQQDAWFNLGNTYYRAQDKNKAMSAYKQAILQNPQDKEAIHNLQLLLQDQQSQQNQNNQNNQNQDQNSPNQDKQDQPDNKGQAPQDKSAQNHPQQPQNAQQEQAKQAADRVLQLARDNEHKRPGQQAQAALEDSVEKDW